MMMIFKSKCSGILEKKLDLFLDSLGSLQMLSFLFSTSSIILEFWVKPKNNKRIVIKFNNKKMNNNN